LQIAWTTDTHLNFINKTKAIEFCKSILNSNSQGLFITGDIAESSDIIEWLQFLETQLQIPIYFVLGNHDYYHSSLQIVRKQVSELCQQSTYLHWLNFCPPVQLTHDISLIGHDGWGDAKYGNFLKTPIRLTDHRLIADLTGWDRTTLQKILQELGKEAGEYIAQQLHQAKKTSSTIWVLTHVPPFPEACWHQGKWGAVDWISDFACKSVGDVLLKFAKDNPNIQLNVLCGHGHSPGEVTMRDNLYIRTGGAEYGNPNIEEVFTFS
jgi:predicted MPP superfamily phosphohydrolase